MKILTVVLFLMVSLVLLAVPTSLVKLPTGKVAQDYRATVGAGYTNCVYDPEGRTNPGMSRGLPPGLTVSATGDVTGTPTIAGFYEGAVNCKEASLKVRIPITQ